jgi:prefoldin subunit 5
MTSEEVERAIKFLLNSQAQLTANVGSLSETVDKLSGTVGKLSEKVDRTADSVIALLAIAEIHEREIETLKQTVEANSGAGRETDDKLNALIATVERLIARREENRDSDLT